MEGEGAFEGVRVVELAQWVFVPVAGALLADWGADVIRIERLEGDPYRGLATQGIGTDSGGVNLSLALAGRGKRSMAVDLQREEGRAVLHQLLATADVFLTSLRPGALHRLGLDADTVTERYPSLVYARGHGYGVRGPDADRPGYDASAFWARGGLAHVLTPPEMDDPIGQRGAMGDRNGAMALAFGIATALLKRTRTQRGSIVDVSLLATAMWTLSSDVLSALQGQKPRAATPGAVFVNPLVGSYRTSDSRHISLVFLESDRYWDGFCRLVGRDDLADDPRFVDLAARGEHSDECAAELRDVFAARTFEEWKSLLAQIDAPWAPVQAVEELLDDPTGARQRLPRRGRCRGRSVVPIADRASAARRASTRAATRARARGAHGGDAARAGLHVGADRRAERGRNHPVSEPTRPVPVPDDQSAPYWEAASAHVLTVARCARCGTFTIPVDLVCRHCGSSDPAYVFEPVSGRGVIRSWTILRQSFLPGFDDDIPFVLVDVELDEQDELRMIGRLLDGPDAPLRIGAHVTVAFEDLASGHSIPAFVLAER